MLKSSIKLEVNEPSKMEGNGSLLAGILVLLALVAALFYGVAGEDKALLISPLAMLGYLCLAGWMSGVAFSRRTVSAAPPGFFLLLLFIAYGAAIGSVSTIPYEAKLRMLELGLYVGAYYLWSNSYSLFRRSRAVLGWVLLLALLGCFYGLVNHFRNPEQVLWAKRYFVYDGRLASTYICPNHLAHLLQMLLPFCLVLILIPRAGWMLRLLAVYCIAVYVPTIYLTESRAGMLGSIAALGVTVCLLALRKSRKLFLLFIFIVPLFSGLLLVGAWKYSDMFQRRMAPMVEFLVEAREKGFADTQTIDFRPLTWLDTIEMIKEKPVTGFGPGSYRYLFEEYRKRCTTNRMVTGHPHNEYLEVTAEYGMVGFVLLALAWGSGLVRLLRFALRTQNQHHAFMAMAFLGTAAGTLLHSFFDFQMYVFQNALVFSLLAAIAVGPVCGRRRESLLRREPVGFRDKLMRPAGKFALAALAAATMLLSLQLFASAFIRAVADRLVEERKPELARRYYQRALAIDPSNWQAYKGMGAVYFKERYYTLDREEKRRLAGMEQEYFAAGYQRNPKDASLVFDLGKATVFLGETEQGLRLLEEAARLRPFNDMYWLRLGVEQRKAERYDEALATFKRARTLHYSPMAQKNIEWLEHRENTQPAPESKARALPEPVIIDTNEAPVQQQDSLRELLKQMENR